MIGIRVGCWGAMVLAVVVSSCGDDAAPGSSEPALGAQAEVRNEKGGEPCELGSWQCTPLVCEGTGKLTPDPPYRCQKKAVEWGLCLGPVWTVPIDQDSLCEAGLTCIADQCRVRCDNEKPCPD